jgi:hypothetical protein
MKKDTARTVLKKSLLRNAVQNIRREIVDRKKGQKK